MSLCLTEKEPVRFCYNHWLLHLRACCWLHTEISTIISVYSIMLNAGLCTLESRHDGKDSRVRWRLRSVTIRHHAAFCGRQTFLSLGFWNSSSHIAASTCCASPQHNQGRPHIGANGVSWPPLEKTYEKLKSEDMQKEKISMFMLYFESNQGRQVQRTALCWPHIYSDILQNAPLCSQIFKIFFASGSKGALTP